MASRSSHIRLSSCAVVSDGCTPSSAGGSAKISHPSPESTDRQPEHVAQRRPQRLRLRCVQQHVRPGDRHPLSLSSRSDPVSHAATPMRGYDRRADRRLGAQ